MIRVEIIANHSVEENILEAFQAEGVAKYYTKFNSIFGVGSSGPRMGDAIWPEENFSIVVWCEKDEVEGIERSVAAVKQQFPDEGIKLFKMESSPASEPKIVPVPQMVVAVPPVPPSAGPAWTPEETLSVLPEETTKPAPLVEPAALAESLFEILESESPKSLTNTEFSSAELAFKASALPPLQAADKTPHEQPLPQPQQEQLWVSSPPVQGMEDENS
jgi:hypothetical protein